jgi:hypothetical protein
MQLPGRGSRSAPRRGAAWRCLVQKGTEVDEKLMVRLFREMFKQVTIVSPADIIEFVAQVNANADLPLAAKISDRVARLEMERR